MDKLKGRERVEQQMEPRGSESVTHRASGMLLSQFALSGRHMLARDALAAQSGVDLSQLQTFLEWLAELGLVQTIDAQSYRLGSACSRSGRQGYHLLLHLEPNLELGGLCHSLLAEHGYPSIGVENVSTAKLLCDVVEFDLALLSGVGKGTSSFLTAHEAVLRHRSRPPAIGYGLQIDGHSPLYASAVTILTGPVEAVTLLSTIRQLLPPEHP